MAGKFHERFEIEVGVVEARRRFVVRIANQVLREFYWNAFQHEENERLKTYIASVLGDHASSNYMDKLIEQADFHRHLQAVEAIYAFAGDNFTYLTPRQANLSALIEQIFAMTEMDIGVRWEAGRFLKQGAPLLDDRLINDPLRWLRTKDYATVVAPYEKALGHLLQSAQNPALLADVVTDAYEALEAFAKIMTERNTDLSGNQELFIRKVKASDSYKRLLKVYIDYANEFRHGKNPNKPRPTPTPGEVESFVYLTGLFIRLATA